MNWKTWRKIMQVARVQQGLTRGKKKRNRNQGGQSSALPNLRLQVNSRKHIEKGDLCLIALPVSHARRLHGKLTLNWMGPFIAVDEVEPYIYRMLNPVSNTTSRHHRARLRLYCERARANIAAVIQWLGSGLQDSMYKLEHIIDLRVNEKTGHYEMEVKWLGFPVEETTWEPLRLYMTTPRSTFEDSWAVRIMPCIVRPARHSRQ
eukprot:GHVU01050194.1.p1 GENE.GHVU01050194.1~~GHVU01050194.1.p1  ORF type:complete len:205 (+),score=10.69 GHVU01050194.1:475-1089(+)